MNSFDAIAPYYDQLAKLVFGRSLQASQSVHIPLIPAHSKILIIGGGTGRSAWEILQVTPGVEIVFVEKSEQMLNIARRRFECVDQPKITFINLPYEEYDSPLRFDVVVAQCYFDLFAADSLQSNINRAKLCLNRGGLMVVSDFQKIKAKSARVWQEPFIWFMLKFFRMAARLESKRLIDINAAIKSTGFAVVEERFFFGQLIFSRVYSLGKK